MTSPAAQTLRLPKALRTGLIVSGVLAVIVGLLMLIKPGASAIVLTTIIAIYALISGVVFVATGIASRTLSGWARVGHIVAGALYLVAGVVMLVNPVASGLTLAYVVVVFLAVSWIFDGVAALTTLKDSPAKGWAVLYGTLSLLGGLALLFAPLSGAVVIWIWFGATLIVLGVVQVVRAVRS